MMAKKLQSQNGFTVPEMLIAIVLVVTLGVATLGALQFFAHAVRARSFSQSGAIALEQELATMRADANTAFAVFVPTNDIFGRPAVTPVAAAHEVDFYAKTDTGVETWWAYNYDSVQGTLRRYDYDPTTGAVGVFDRKTGAIDPRGRYPAVTGVRSFAAQTIQANALTDSNKSVFAPIVSGLIGHNRVPQADPVGFVPSNNQPRADLYGGNTTVAIDIQTEHGGRSLHLLSGTMPSGFTIHEKFTMRAFVYRINTIHRFWIGLAQKTKAHIFEQLQYSYTPANPKSWKVWCDYELYGSSHGGLQLNDPKVNYHPNQFPETTGSIYYAVTHASVGQLNPSGACNGHVPTPAITPAPAYTGPTGNVYDTPPPCFAQGQCWPNNAPPNFTPPSPWPAQSPPPAWCAGHQLSPLCGGPGGPPVIITSSPPPPVYYTPSPPVPVGT